LLLSICIPTHDGRDWSLDEAIRSVLPQIAGRFEGEVEICVSDNGSTDRTREILKQYGARYPALLRAFRFPTNVGGRLNFLKVVEIATGRYCWFLGSDDAFEPGAIAHMVDVVRAHPDVAGYCVNRTRFDSLLKSEIEEVPRHHPSDPERFHLYTDANAILSELAVWQNYVSGVVFRRDYWNAVVEADGVKRITSYRHYTHSYVFSRISMDHPTWAWIPERLVKYRSDNDSYVALGSKPGAFIAEANDDMRRQLRDTIGTRSGAYRKIMRDLFDLWWSADGLRSWKLQPGANWRDDWTMLCGFTKCSWQIPEFWLRAFPMLVTPRVLYAARVKLGLRDRLRRLNGR
jgi:abequosyltransferase